MYKSPGCIPCLYFLTYGAQYCLGPVDDLKSSRAPFLPLIIGIARRYGMLSPPLYSTSNHRHLSGDISSNSCHSYHGQFKTETGATLAVTWALMELFWTNEKAAMAARPRPLPPSPPPSHTPRPLLDPLRRPPANGRAASPPPYESDGGRAMADGVMADEQKFVSPAAGIRTRAPTNARLSR
ncbi:hypothetical protein J6590_091073 [Homalodisca vitripennis]|nr:hypothetical protein J6590_091073 [Homalodisca vitripennis]